MFGRRDRAKAWGCSRLEFYHGVYSPFGPKCRLHWGEEPVIRHAGSLAGWMQADPPLLRRQRAGHVLARSLGSG